MKSRASLIWTKRTSKLLSRDGTRPTSLNKYRWVGALIVRCWFDGNWRTNERMMTCECYGIAMCLRLGVGPGCAKIELE